MKLEGTIHCQGPECEKHQHVGMGTMEADRLPVGWLRVVEYASRDRDYSYCSWDCVMKDAAKLPPPEVIEA